MLVLKRREGESILVNGNIVIKQLGNGRIGIEAPSTVPIVRSELIGRTHKPNAQDDPLRN